MGLKIRLARAGAKKRPYYHIVVADSRKLRQRSSMIVTSMRRITTLVTDVGATEQELEPLRKAGVKVIQVDVETNEAAEDDAGMTG